MHDVASASLPQRHCVVSMLKLPLQLVSLHTLRIGDACKTDLNTCIPGNAADYCLFRAGSIIRCGIRYSSRLSQGLGRPDSQIWASHSASVGNHNSAATDRQATGAGWSAGPGSSIWQPCQSGWHQGHFQANAPTLDSFERLCSSLHIPLRVILFCAINVLTEDVSCCCPLGQCWPKCTADVEIGCETPL